MLLKSLDQIFILGECIRNLVDAYYVYDERYRESIQKSSFQFRIQRFVQSDDVKF